jgi:hypothetical protein
MASDPATTALIGGAGRGSTVLCLGAGEPVLQAVAAIAGGTGLVLLVGPDPTPGTAWRPVRCDPPAAIPVRSHVIDAAVVATADRLPELVAELRRVLAPRADLRLQVSLTDADSTDSVLHAAGFRPLQHVILAPDEPVVLVTRAP